MGQAAVMGALRHAKRVHWARLHSSVGTRPLQSALATHSTQPTPGVQTGVAAVLAQFRDVVAVPSGLQVTAVVPVQVIAPGVQIRVFTQLPPWQLWPGGQFAF